MAKCLVYLDDIFVVGKTLDRLLVAAGLKLKAKKLQSVCNRRIYGTHVLCRWNSNKAVKEWEAPSNVSELRPFLGFCSYYRCFAENSAAIAKHLHELNTTGSIFRKTDDCQTTFDILCKKLSTFLVLALSDFEERVILTLMLKTMQFFQCYFRKKKT